MTDNFPACVAFTMALGNEGGFVNNPADPGGATNFGITIEGLSDWRGHPCSVEDVRDMHATEAQAIYRGRYWLPSTEGALLPGLDLMVFDFGVNHGPAASVKMLQQIIGVPADGYIGPETISRAECGLIVLRARIQALGHTQLAFYASLHSAAFGKGWAARTQRRVAAAMAMTVPPVAKPTAPKPAAPDDAATDALNAAQLNIGA